MKKCPTCGRTYSDLVEQCPTCGVDLSGVSGSQPEMHSQEKGNQQTHIYEAVNIESSKKGNATLWKALTAVSLIFALIFLVLFVQRNSEYDDLKWRYNRTSREYNELSQDYEDLESVFALYNLDGKYAVELTDVYNGTDDYDKISEELIIDNLDSICIEFSVYDFSESWTDVIYADVVTPSGEVFVPKAENENHTWKMDLKDTQGEVHYRRAWWHASQWMAGTYRVVFYQENSVIASFNFEVK